MYRRVTPPKRVTLPTWGPPPPCKQALRQLIDPAVHRVFMNLKMYHADGNSDGT